MGQKRHLDQEWKNWPGPVEKVFLTGPFAYIQGPWKFHSHAHSIARAAALCSHDQNTAVPARVAAVEWKLHSAFSGVLTLNMFSCSLPHLLSLIVVEPHGSLEASESSRVATYRMRVVQQLDSLGGMKLSFRIESLIFSISPLEIQFFQSREALWEGPMSEVPRRRWKPGPKQHPGQENQDSQHMLLILQGAVKTVFWGNGVFGKLPKTGGFDEKWRKWRFTFYPQKQGVVLPRARKPTKITKMAGVPQTKPGFTKNRVFATLIYNGAFCKQFSPLRYGTFISLEKGKFVFQKSLSETPFKPDRVSFCTPNLMSRDKTCRETFWGGGGLFYLQLEVFRLQFKLLCSQSLTALIRRTFPLSAKKTPIVSKKAKL